MDYFTEIYCLEQFKKMNNTHFFYLKRLIFLITTTNFHLILRKICGGVTFLSLILMIKKL